jgi:UDP-2,3-diacylglucosamine pyrophosphatase LpxH
MATNCRLYRTIWLSDVHLGCKDSKADYLLNFLRHSECSNLILAGDIFDLWELKRQPKWQASHTELLHLILERAQQGTRVVYVPGNHDEAARKFVHFNNGLIELHTRYTHETASGRKLLVVHGDEFDGMVTFNWWHARLGDITYDLLLFLNRWYNRVNRAVGRPYWSLANYIKLGVKNVNLAVARFKEAACDLASDQNADGIVCGHIHCADLSLADDCLYLNCGDWIESCTMMVEHLDGRIEMLRATEKLETLAMFKAWQVMPKVVSQQAEQEERVA